MTRGIDKRVRNLEAYSGGQACEECGDGGGGPSTWEVVWMGPSGPSEPRWCGTCGRPLEIVVTWDDIPDPKGAV